MPPKAGFAFGNRYEFGYQDQDHGWLIGVLDGPELNQTRVLRLCPRDPHASVAVCRRSSTTDYTTGRRHRAGRRCPNAGVDLRAFGFGSVPVLFETPPGYLIGFRDYLNILADAAIGTQGGPMLYVGNYGMPATEDRRRCRCRILPLGRRPRRRRYSWGDAGHYRWRRTAVARLGVIHRLRRPARVQRLLRQRDRFTTRRRPTASRRCGRTCSRTTTTWRSTRTTR